MNADDALAGPEDARAMEREADALMAGGEPGAAVALYRRITERGLADEFTWCHLGDAYVALEEYVQAIDAYEAALDCAPDAPALHVNLARPLYLVGEADAAAAHLERAIPHMEQRTALENLATIAPGVPGYDARRILAVRRAFGDALAHPEKHPKACLDEALAQCAEGGPRPAPEPRQCRARAAGAPLRVAYLSAHFARPAYMGPVWALINHHDRDRHQIFLLSDAPVNAPLPDYAPREGDTIVDVSTAKDADLARFIAAREIDLLVDLSGYSYKPRLGLFATRAAPAVATWFNMYATSGLPGIDYIIGDGHVVRPGEESDYSETVLRLPQSYLTFRPWEGRPPVAPCPCSAGAPFTFGSLVSLYKITPPVVDAWCALLKRAPAARLLLANADLKSAHNREWLRSRFTRQGIDPERILLREPAPHDAFLRYYDEVDLALDSFPYSGGTTTMEAIWQGVPVLTHAGGGWAARTTGSLLAGTHLADFCCRDVAHYMDHGAALANDAESPAHLARLRATMRDELRRCPALDGAALARHMEALYADM